MQETHGQYWEIGIYGLGRNANFFYIDPTVKKDNPS